MDPGDIMSEVMFDWVDYEFNISLLFFVFSLHHPSKIKLFYKTIC